MKESIINVQNLRNAWQVVRSKDSSGGADGINIQDYGRNSGRNLVRLSKLLSKGQWKPCPYVDAQIPKSGGDVRLIGLASVEDKIVQTAIKNIVEPLLEKTFSSSSYAYRPGRGHLRCVRRMVYETMSKENTWYFRADIDDYFDSVDRGLLFKRLKSVIKDEWVVEMIDLCVSMGRIDSTGKWIDSRKGLPQGAVLSPILANFYLNSFDQSMTSRNSSYVRYSDDFVVLGSDETDIRKCADVAVAYLQDKMSLTLNEPYSIGRLDEGFDFLGLHFSRNGVSVTELKLEELSGMIEDVKLENGQLSRVYVKSLEGIRRYYLNALPSSYLLVFKKMMDDVCARWENSGVAISQKMVAQIRRYVLGDDLVNKVISKNGSVSINKAKAIRSRKLEYRKIEAENAELVISGHGYFLGVTGQCVTLRKNGQPIKVRSNAIRHITVIGHGIGISSNIIAFCRDKGISIDFFSMDGEHLSSLLSPSYMTMSLWNRQAELTLSERCLIARKLILFKLKNQRNFCQYLNKYHGGKGKVNEFSSFLVKIDSIIATVKTVMLTETFSATLMSYEAHAAVEYWEYIRNVVEDSGVEFYSRVKRGAKDVVNSMLNFGYSILYPRIWQAVLRHGLNPYSGFIHRSEGNANLVFDLIELFRCQAVDRVVVSMINKGEKCDVDTDGKLCEYTKASLTRHVLERLERYETYRGESRTLNNIIDLQVLDLSRFISDGLPFRPYVAKW